MVFTSLRTSKGFAGSFFRKFSELISGALNASVERS